MEEILKKIKQKGHAIVEYHDLWDVATIIRSLEIREQKAVKKEKVDKGWKLSFG